jgi:hypothetical protein
MIDAFEELLDQLYWSGFSAQLKQDDPDRYQWEYLEFCELYG